MRLVTLIDLGAGALPAQTPAPARFARWFPVVHQPAVVPPVDGAGTTPVADGVLLEWDAVESGGAVVIYVIERSLSEAGPWEEVTRTTETRYLYSDGTGQTWYFRITATVRGQAGGSEIVVGTPELAARQQALDQEIADRLQGDLQTAQAAAADATAKADAARDAAIAHADVIGAQVADILDADEWTATAAYPKGDLVKRAGKLYRALRANTNKAPESNPADWQLIGNYTSLGEAVAASIDMATQNASDIEVESTRLDGVVARMPTGTGKVASEASVTAEATARTNADAALAGRTSTIEGRMPAGTDKLANEARVVQAEQAAASANSATAGRVQAIETRMPSGTGSLATAAAVDAISNTVSQQGNAINAQSAALTSLTADVGAANSAAANIANPSFEASTGWNSVAGANNDTLPAGVSYTSATSRTGARCLVLEAPAGNVFNRIPFSVSAGEQLDVSFYAGYIGATPPNGYVRLSVSWRDAAGASVGSVATTAQLNTSVPRWQLVSGKTPVPPAGAVTGYLYIQSAHTTGAWAVDDVKVERVAAATAANSSAISAQQVQVNQQGQQIASMASDLSSVSATAGNASASITRLMEVEAASNGVGLVDGGFETSIGWGQASVIDTPDIVLPAKTQYRSDIFRSGGRCLRFDPAIASAVSAFNNSWLRVQAGQKVRITFWARITGSVPTSAGFVRMSVRRWPAGGGGATYTASSVSVPVTGLGTTWQKFTGIYTVPAGDAVHQWAMQCLNDNSNTAVYVDDVSVELIGEEQEVARARETLVIDVNGNVSGTVNENDGQRSSFSILATVFRVISNLTGMGMEWQDGYLRIWKSAAQLVLGHTFGSGNLVMWYGPNVGAASCTKANATFWLDTSGGAYFGGSLSAGALKNAVQTTTTVTVGTELINGPFSTNGNVRAVTISFARNTAYVSNASGSGGFSGGSGTNTATVAVYRRIGNAAETLWQTLNVSGGLEIFNEPDAPDRANSYWSGAMTVNDTSPATDAVRYRAVITAFSAQAVEHPGTINSITTTQNLAIVSVES